MTTLDRTADARRRGAELVIDGEAIVVGRVSRVKSAVERAASAPRIFPSDEPAPATDADCPVFGRRPAPRHDLFFQHALRGGPRAARSRRDGLSSFLSDTAGSIPAGGKMAGLGLLVLSLLVPAALLAKANEDDGARVLGAADGTGFILEDIEAGIRPRGGGAVLQVGGAIRNLSGAAAPVPALRIALADAAGTTTRPLDAGARTLAAGARLRFHSAVAVPLGTDGEVSVGFAPPMPARDVADIHPIAAGDERDSVRYEAPAIRQKETPRP